MTREVVLPPPEIMPILVEAKRLLETHRYQHKFNASTLDGLTSAQPRDAPEYILLSFRGALTAACSTLTEKTTLLTWMDNNWVLPKVEPRTKTTALTKITQAIAAANGRIAA